MRLCLAIFILLGSSSLAIILKNSTNHAHAAFPVAVSKTWYFAEGRVGAGFVEYLTLSNPSSTTDCSAQIQYLPDGNVPGNPHRQPVLSKTVQIPHASRYTTSVNHDLHIQEHQNPGLSLSTIITVPSTSACAGIVAERPMYFNYHGVPSGSDVVGATSQATTFYFPDVPTAAGTSSFINSYLTILNPPGGTSASVTATYYATGQQVGTQTASVAAGSRGTISPEQLTLPTHVAAIVTSDVPVVVERASYQHNVQEGIAGIVSSAAAIVGTQALSDDWFFAEGYTGGQSQENLVLANLSSTPTNATIILEYQNGHNQAITLAVPALRQTIFDVNQANANPTGVCDTTPCDPTPEVSVEVTATSPSLVVERQMFFRYTHSIEEKHDRVDAAGGTDVIGATAPANGVATFAEGYVNTGYNEWLTLQNPTTQPETLEITLLNENGQTYTQSIQIAAKSRATVDITNQALQNLVRSGDDDRGYEVSVTVQATGTNTSFVAERPMYFHPGHEGIEGGTDVVGFSGPPSGTPTPSPTGTSSITPSATTPTVHHR